jgi:hypothetical protein
LLVFELRDDVKIVELIFDFGPVLDVLVWRAFDHMYFFIISLAIISFLSSCIASELWLFNLASSVDIYQDLLPLLPLLMLLHLVCISVQVPKGRNLNVLRLMVV